MDKDELVEQALEVAGLHEEIINAELLEFIHCNYMEEFKKYLSEGLSVDTLKLIIESSK